MSADNDACPWKKLQWNFNCKGDAGLIPVHEHQGGELIFENEEGKFKDLFFKRKVPVKGSTTTTKTIEFSSCNDAMIKATKTFSAAGDAAIGQILCSSVYAESKYTRTESSVSIRREHILHPKFTIRLPQESDIQKYLAPAFRKKLDNIQSKEDAKELVEKMGGGLYITSATFGGMRIKSKYAQVQRNAHDNTKTKGISGGTKLSPALGDIGHEVSASFENTNQAAGSNNAQNENTDDNHVGGDQNQDDWIKSIEGNEDIVDLELARISRLLQEPKDKRFKPKVVKKFATGLLKGANPTLLNTGDENSREDDPDNYPHDHPDNEMTKEWKEKKKWLDDSITEYAKARYNTELKEVKQRVIRELDNISDNDDAIINAIHAKTVRQERVNDIFCTPVKELREKIDNNPAMTEQEIGKELRNIKKELKKKMTRRRFVDKGKKFEFYKKLHGKIKDVLAIVSPNS